jgi:hypothetical protein
VRVPRRDGGAGELVADDPAVALGGDGLGGAQVPQRLGDGGVVDPGRGARSETLIGPAAWMQASSVSLVGSPSSANWRARASMAPGSPRAAMASHARSPSMTR